MHLGGVAFHGFAVILHLIKGGRITVTINDFFTLLTARACYHNLVGIDFDGALGHDNITGEGHHIPLHIQRLLIGVDMDRLLGIAGHRKRRKTGGKKDTGQGKIKAEFVCSEFHRSF